MSKKIDLWLRNRQQVEQEISVAAKRSGRPAGAVRLIAVTKYLPDDALPDILAAGHRDLGENRLQQAEPKIVSDGNREAIWHFIGSLQKNKAKRVVARFDCIQSVDTVELGQVIADEAEKVGKVMPVLLQVNVAHEPQKHGFSEDNLASAVSALNNLSNLRLCGLMTMAPIAKNPEETRPVFRALRHLRDAVRQEFHLTEFAELSMGMSEDFAIAVEEGATMVRIGRRLFLETEKS